MISYFNHSPILALFYRSCVRLCNTVRYSSLIAYPNNSLIRPVHSDNREPTVVVDHGYLSILHFSQKLRAPERKYSAFGLLALYLSVWHFHYFLEGRQFIDFTDHKPLPHCTSKVSAPGSNCQQQQHCLRIGIHNQHPPCTCTRKGKSSCRHTVYGKSLRCANWN